MRPIHLLFARNSLDCFSHESYFSLSDVDDDNDYASDDEDEADEEDMAPRPPARRAPPVAAPRARAQPDNSPRRAAAAHGSDGDDVVNSLGGSFNRVLSLRPPFTPYNFSYRFPVIFTVTGTLSMGNMAVYVDYFVPSLHLSRFHPELSADGMVITLAMAIPSTFIDMAFRAGKELDPTDEDSVAFVSAFCTVTGVIALSHPDFENVVPPGQEDTLPFPCQQRMRVTHVLHSGDDLLYQQFSRNSNFNPEARRQLYPFFRVELRSLEVARIGGAFVDVGAIAIHAPRQSMNGVGAFGDGGGGGGGGVPQHGGAPGGVGASFHHGAGGGGGQQQANAAAAAAAAGQGGNPPPAAAGGGFHLFNADVGNGYIPQRRVRTRRERDEQQAGRGGGGNRDGDGVVPFEAADY